jgi:alkanesulfonate monooxygenase SsuD/methylene tetrahydromethanopterin reductase-like flavin-dependent oxidoreductase (luciferase family)
MNNPKPLQSKVPVCIGGTGKTRTLPLAARFADHWNCGGTDAARFAECRSVLHEACDAIGRDPAEITCSATMRYEGDADALSAAMDAFEQEGCELAIVGLPKSAPPSVVEDVAELISRR